ncbi:phosphotransferase family protein [Nocardia farcinica]|uniref:phosphotransferase family protein n=1 Tax=Nocardia farcinica TaxID=37329 RepID=UPI0018956F18|nr:phosphotransferase family protein [Nocardia farcinica]MBF6262398.1 phosphotransferase family protein [Nocardia farcinica]MBF6280938.1 phosphotransferase family protein [Nocardia farcinica]MBF6304605.1 phosphotransferase family protein [Nocardia farcinica]MBF6390791.1 phosphotransferase family protein [Nocardia farcinica]MBF6492046.1 phosphotransferase family protein [Nocardia farcinica]
MSALRDALLDMLAELGVRDITEPTRLGGGSSQENWAFDADIDTPDGPIRRPLLMRREPVTGVVETSRDVEFALLRALGTTGLPVPRVHLLDDGSRLERGALIVDRLSGRAHRGVLRDTDPLGLGEEARLRLAAALPTLLADVHAVDVEALGLRDILPAAADPGTAELDRWERELDRVELEPHPGLREVIAWLRAHVPPPGPVRLVHGDFRPANVLVAGDEIVALLDWELAHLGDPHDDLGWYTCSVYRREHFLDRRWTVTDFLDSWSRTSGLAVDPRRLHFWQVMSAFRLAVIALTGVRAFCDGTTDRPAAPTTGIERAALRETGLLDAAPEPMGRTS